MTPVTQTKMYRPKDHPEGPQSGNCQRAAMASLLEIGIDDMPPFEEEGRRFWCAINEWLDQRGLEHNCHSPKRPPAGYAMAYGPSPRGVNHAVVVLDGAAVFDPHPSRAGLLRIDCFATLDSDKRKKGVSDG